MSYIRANGPIIRKIRNISYKEKTMIFIEENVEWETEFNKQEIAEKVVNQVLKREGCPFECEVDILITDSEEIKEYNEEYRDIDKATDVLSFPNLEWEEPGDFESAMNNEFYDVSVNPETDLLILGEICLNKDRILEQAKEYGHSVLREYAFLIAHSMYHLIGYDHMAEDEAAVMEQKQKESLEEIGISR